MAGKLRYHKAIHEAAHAVIARKLNIEVRLVSARAHNTSAEHGSEPMRLLGGVSTRSAVNDFPETIDAYARDTMVALAGHAANRRDLPDLIIYDVLTEDEDRDTINARSFIYRMICLQQGRSIPRGDFQVAVSLDETFQKDISQAYLRLIEQTTNLVEQHWLAIKRVAKHLERHDFLDQDELDALIERVEGLAADKRG